MITFVGIAHPRMCDAMHHMNNRHYAAMFDDASFQLLAAIAGANESEALGWADVRMEIDFKQEVTAGSPITIRSHIERIGRSSLSYFHVMTHSQSRTILARAKTVSVRFTLQTRTKVELSAELRSRAAALFEQATSA